MNRIIPILPPNVVLFQNHLLDTQLDVKIPINPVAFLILKYVDGSTNMGNIISCASNQFKGKDQELISGDIILLFRKLNDNNLLNFKHCRQNYFSSLYNSLFRSFRFPERIEINGKSFYYIFRQISFLIFKKLFLLFVITILIDLCLVFLVGSTRSFLLITPAYFSIISSFALHETIHVYIFRKYNGRLGFLTIDWKAIKFVKPIKSKGNIISSLMGPLIPGTLGVLGILASFNVLSFMISFTFFIHIFYLLPFWGDGKNILLLLKLTTFKEIN